MESLHNLSPFSAIQPIALPITWHATGHSYLPNVARPGAYSCILASQVQQEVGRAYLVTTIRSSLTDSQRTRKSATLPDGINPK